MNAKVTETIHPKALDVLAVLDDAISDFGDPRTPNWHGIAAALMAAYAAVAELIQAAEGMRSALANGDDLRARLAALDAALVRVRGCQVSCQDTRDKATGGAA